MTIFGFEYDSTEFDWIKEFRLVAEQQRKQYGYKNNSTTIGDVEVIHLPNEGWFVFSIDDVIYGVAESQLEKTLTYIERVLHLRVNQKPIWAHLRSDRRFRRRVAATYGNTIQGHGIFIYWNPKDMFRRIAIQSSHLRWKQLKQHEVPANVRRCFDDFVCYACTFCFNSIGNTLHYRISYPLHSPTSKPVSQLMREFDDITIPKVLPLPPNSTHVSLARVRSPKPGFPMSTSPSRILLMSIPTLNLFPEADYVWENDKADLFNILDGVSADPENRFEINYFAYDSCDPAGSVRLYGNQRMPGAILPSYSVGTADSLLERINRYCAEHDVSIPQVIFNSQKASGSKMGWGGGPSRSGFPEQPLVLESLLTKTFDSSAYPATFRVLLREQVGQCDVFFIGQSKVEFVLVDNSEYIVVLPRLYTTRRSDYGVAQMIEKLSCTKIASVSVPSEFTQRFYEEDEAKQFIYQTKFHSRFYGIDRWYVAAVDGLFEGVFEALDRESDETFSLPYIVQRVLLNVIGLVDIEVEDMCLRYVRTSEPLDWYRALSFRHGSAIQIGSMMLRE